jgi:chemotaxis protein CheX
VSAHMMMPLMREKKPGAGMGPARDGRDCKNQRESHWVCQIDEAVAEVFETMLRLPCVLVDETPAKGATVSARIVFSGAIDGECVVLMPAAAAGRLTDTLLETEGDWDDEMLDDTVGELCNMIAGGWKSRSGMDAECQISVPAFSRSATRKQMDEGHGAMRRFYGLGEDVLEVAMVLTRAGTGGDADRRPVPFPSCLIA